MMEQPKTFPFFREKNRNLLPRGQWEWANIRTSVASSIVMSLSFEGAGWDTVWEGHVPRYIEEGLFFSILSLEDKFFSETVEWERAFMGGPPTPPSEQSSK